MTPSADGEGPRAVQRTAATQATARRASGASYQRDSRHVANQVGKGLLLGVFVLGIGVALFFHFKSARFVNLVSRDAIDAAQVAYNFRTHKKLQTSVIYPAEVAGSHPDTRGYDIGRPPLYCALLGVFFKTRGVSDDAVVMFNALCMFALAWVLYGIILVAYDKSIAVWSVLAYFSSVQIIGLALTANGILLTTLLFCLALLLTLHLLRRSRAATNTSDEQAARTPAALPWPWLIGIGLAGGLAYLAGYFSPLLWLVLAAMAAASLGRWRKPALLTVLGVAIVLGAVWWGRNLVTIGTPWSKMQTRQLVMGTSQYPGDSLLRTTSGLPGNAVIHLITHPRGALRKLAQGILALYRAIPDIANLYLWPFLIGGLLWLPKTAERRLLWFVFLWALLLQVGGALFTNASDAALGVVRPLALGLAVGSLILWLRSLKLARGGRLLASLAAILVISVPYVASLLLGAPVRPGPSVAALSQLPRILDIPQSAVFATDNPWLVAWYGHRRAILLPKSPQELAAVAKATRQPHFLYFTADWRRTVKNAQDPWVQVLRDRQAAPRLGMPLPLPNNELLILTPQGAKEFTETRTRFKKAYEQLRSRNRRSASPTGAPGDAGRGN